MADAGGDAPIGSGSGQITMTPAHWTQNYPAPTTGIGGQLTITPQHPTQLVPEPTLPAGGMSISEMMKLPKTRLIPKVTKLAPRVALPRTRITRLSQARGMVDVPFGTRIAGRETRRTINLDHLLATDAERLCFAWLCDNEIPFDFESSALNGRVDLNFAIAPFLLAEQLKRSKNQALRFYEQASGRTTIEGEFLSICGYEVIDISEAKLLNNVDGILLRVLEFE